jgi:hypothetical protein
MMSGVRALVIVCVLAACGGAKPAAPGAVAKPGAPSIPAQATYVIGAQSVRAGQNAIRGMVEALDASDAGPELARVLGVDPFDASAVAGIGVDLDGRAYVFSEGVNPTFVVPLKSAEQMTGFLDGQKQNGVRTQSVISGGTEVFAAKLSSDLTISWAVDTNWMWLHFAFDKPDGFDWFEHARQAGGTALPDVAASVSGWMDLHGIVAAIGRVTNDPEPIACAKQLLAVKRMGLDVDADLRQLNIRLAFDLGASADRLRAAILAPPPGWTTASAGAPLAAQWNIDAAAAAAWLAPCIGDDDLGHELAEYGVRTLRGFVRELDPDDKDGVGAISADLSNATFFKAQLDEIPGRSILESGRTFGIYKGKHLKVPMVATADYVLSDQLLIVAMGDKVLETIGSGTAAAAPAFELAVRPSGLGPDVWKFLLDAVHVDDAKRAVQLLQLWSELSVTGRLDGSTLTFTAHAARR